MEYPIEELAESASLSRDDVVEIHEEICQRAREEMKDKSDDYAHGDDALRNFKAYEFLQLNSTEGGICERMVDKMTRLANIINKGEASVEDETFQDTIRDLINYAILLESAHRGSQ